MFVEVIGSVPARGRDSDAGYDLVAHTVGDGIRVPAGGFAMIPTGTSVAIPEGFAGLVTPRSGLAAKHGLTVLNSPGLVDPGFQGAVQVILLNTSDRDYVVTDGERIAQFVFVKVEHPEFSVVGEFTGVSVRGGEGFGSSGTH